MTSVKSLTQYIMRVLPQKNNLGGRVKKLEIAYISGEPETPGHIYRVVRPAESLTQLGHHVRVFPATNIELAVRKCKHADLVIVWRTPWSTHLGKAFSIWKANGVVIGFDVDDHMIDPSLAEIETIDGIRSQGFQENLIKELYQKIGETLLHSDFGTAPTENLASAMRRMGKPTFVIPNGFDDELYWKSRRAANTRNEQLRDGLLRIGYAAGSLTHQRDFKEASKAITNVLQNNRNCRLVLFHAGSTRIVNLDEFPELDEVSAQIEWRSAVPLESLCHEMARFDINIAPLQPNNPFCESKSELKYFEAALVGVPTVASPTQPFAVAIKDKVTGHLAATDDEWESSLNKLLDDGGGRKEMGLAALNDILWKYGPDSRRNRLDDMIIRLFGSYYDKARSFRNSVLGAEESHSPVLPKHEVLLNKKDGIPEVSVVITNYNYSRYIEEALNSVASQVVKEIELIVVDDCSTDHSIDVIMEWMQKHQDRFASMTVIQNTSNSGICLTRNVGFSYSDAIFVFPLDADNRITPKCLGNLLSKITQTCADAAHPSRLRFGNDHAMCPAEPWMPDRLLFGNYIDAMALIKKAAWAYCGGYKNRDVAGWEDYELWCCMIERGMWSVDVPEAVAEYRVHEKSMLHTTTNVPENQKKLKRLLNSCFKWLDL